MKKKGSALILAVLMLSFFTAIALTMFTIAKNRNQRSISKIKGNTIDKGLDIGTKLAHYELYLSAEYVTKGYLYDRNDYDADNSTYNSPTSSQDYSTDITVGGSNVTVPIAGEHYTGIVLNNYDEYFVALWDPQEGSEITTDTSSLISDSEVLKQPWVRSESVSSGKVISRDWENKGGDKVKRLWEYSLGDKVSVGGYRLISIDGEGKNGSALTLPLSGSDLDTTEDTSITFVYEKIVSINDDNINNDNLNYRITYEEEVEMSSNGINFEIESDEGSITVEKIEE